MRRLGGYPHVTSFLGLLAWAAPVVLDSRIAVADDAAKPIPSVEMWSGTEATQNSWYAYSGLIYAFGGDIYADGWQLRVTTGGGTYSYEGRLIGQTLESEDVVFRGTVLSGDISVAYQHHLGPMIARAFLGASYIDHQISPEDVFNEVSGSEAGALAGLDLWLDIDARTWAAAGGSYDTAFSTYSGYVSAGYRVLPNLSLGLEAGAFGNATLDAGRIGALLRWDTGYGELNAAGGLSGDYADPTTPFGRVDWLVRF